MGTGQWTDRVEQARVLPAVVIPALDVREIPMAGLC